MIVAMNLNQTSRRDFLVLASAALPMLGSAHAIGPKSFEIQVKNGVRLVNDWISLKQDNDDLWQKQSLLVNEIKYDVVKSESALRPLVGIIQVSVVSMFSVKQHTRAEAESEQNIEDTPRVPRERTLTRLNTTSSLNQAMWVGHSSMERLEPLCN
jgi:hypothetical protein